MKELSLNDLLAQLPTTQEFLITARRLSILLGADESCIRKKINEARSIGIPICSTKRGYYLSNEVGDIQKTIRFLTKRLNTQIKAINGLKARLKGANNEQR